MTEQEKYLFDLQGYLAVPNTLDAEQVAALNALLDEHLAEEAAPDAASHRFVGLLGWGKPFRDLIDNSPMLPYLDALLGPNFRLDHDYADVIRTGKGPIGTMLHGGATPHDAGQFYHFTNGQMYNGLMVVAYNLKDVHPGDGGFGCVPGSHQSHYRFPNEWRDLSNPQECHRAVTGPAGTAIIFTEALTHGTMPWSGQDERRTLFFKYSPFCMSWAARYYSPDDYLDLTERQQAILEPPNARYPGRQTQRYGG